MINTDNLPKHWRVVKLGEMFKIERGGSPRPIKKYITNDENGINWIKIGDTDTNEKYIYSSRDKITEEGAKYSRYVKEDDFLLTNSMSFGRPYILKTSGCIHDGWLVIRKNSEVDSDFLFYLLSANSTYSQFSFLAKGSTVKNLNIEAVQQVQIPLPPIEEQRTIVTKIEELFSRLDNAKHQLLQAQEQLKLYRQSLLNAAFTGKITYPNQSPGTLPTGWKWVKLGEVCETSSGGTPSRSNPKYYTGTIPWVKSGELGKGIITATEEYLTTEAVRNSSAKIFPSGSLVIALYGATIGKVSFLGIDATTNQAVCGIMKSKEINEHFLYYYLVYKKSDLCKQAVGGAQPNISQKILRELEIPLPPLEEQKDIVRVLELHLNEQEKFEQTISVALGGAETLKQSILQQAFEGKLR